MLLENKKVAIIGAGPVGLTMARLLQQTGARVTVYERDSDPQARIWGGTLDLHANSGQPALAKAGLLEDYYGMAIPMGRTLADEQGNVFFSTTPQHDSPEINRNDLKTILMNSLTNGTVIWDRKFTGLDEQNGSWFLHFENKPDVTADVVIGANGGMSSLRKYVTDATVAYTGSFIIQGEVSQPEIKCPDFFRLCDGNILMASHNGNLLVANPRNNHLLSYNVMFAAPEEWTLQHGLNFQDAAGITAFLTERLSLWANSYQQLFRATSFFVGLPTRMLPLDQPWKSNRPLPVTLIGDAAHLMSPFAGQGVNTGLMDALILSDNLTNGQFETMDAAISDYEQKMFVYARAAQEESRINETAMHRPDFSFKKRFDN